MTDPEAGGVACLQEQPPNKLEDSAYDDTAPTDFSDQPYTGDQDNTCYTTPAILTTTKKKVMQVTSQAVVTTPNACVASKHLIHLASRPRFPWTATFPTTNQDTRHLVPTTSASTNVKSKRIDAAGTTLYNICVIMLRLPIIILRIMQCYTMYKYNPVAWPIDIATLM